MKIGIIGLGYVGYSLSLLYSLKHNVTAIDIDKEKISKLNLRIPLLKDSDAENLLKNNHLDLTCSSELEDVSNCDVIFICLPTVFVEKDNRFNTKVIEKTILKLLGITNKKTLFIIKSTVPVGFCKNLNKKFKTNRIMFSPEFLRENSAIKDNFYPARIIIGGSNIYHKITLDLLKGITRGKNIPLFGMTSCEAESIKLASNTYLAMRIAFFNELDSFSLKLGLNTKNIIDGVCADSRIGNEYNNPSFGYGGICLPKDTRQLFSQTENFSHNSIFSAIIESNLERISFISKKLIESNAQKIGIYGIAMKKGSDNFRESSIVKLINLIQQSGTKEVIIYDPDNLSEEISGIKLQKDFNKFISLSDLIVANRLDKKISNYPDKIFTRDIFGRD